MTITLADTLFLVAALAVLMLGYVNRRTATAQASRALVKDHLKGEHHFKQDKTMLVLRDRLSLQTGMLVFSALGALFALVSAAFVVLEQGSLAKTALILGLGGGIVSLIQSLRESSIANRAHFGELDATVSKDDPYYQSAP